MEVKIRTILNFPDTLLNLQSYLCHFKRLFFGDEVLINEYHTTIIILHRSAKAISSSDGNPPSIEELKLGHLHQGLRISSQYEEESHESSIFLGLIDEMALKANEARMPQFKLVEGSRPISFPLLHPT